MGSPKRLCLMCFDDWAHAGDWACPVCRLAHDRRKATPATNARQYESSPWWGPTGADVNPEDISSGFHIDAL